MSHTRRDALRLTTFSALAARTQTSSAKPASQQRGGLSLNEDNSHYFYTRSGRELDAAAVDSWVDQYANTQVRELMISPNCMRTSYGSKVWDPIWRGYDPAAGDDQPLFASLAPDARASARKWVHTAWQLDHDGIDVYQRWIARARKLGVSPWLSMRMNDVHNADDERCFIHSEFWRSHPEFRRSPYHFGSWTDRALDYGHPEVRAHSMRLVEELAGRYDFDGLELDWMRFGFHFRPGHEAEGLAILTQFTADVRALLNRWEKRRGHRIQLAARVASRPQTAVGLGMDAVRWAHEGLIDMLVVCPFWATIETDMPVELWRQLLAGTKVTLAAGLEVLLRPYPGSELRQSNSLETVRGAAMSLLDRGADRVYLFNYMDEDDSFGDKQTYARLLRECGQFETMAGKPRRHVVTYADTWAPGEPHTIALPARCEAGAWRAFRLHTGPKPTHGKVEVRLSVGAGGESLRAWTVRLNGFVCPFLGAREVSKPRPDEPLYAFNVPADTLNRGYNLVEIQATSSGRIDWVEIAADLG